MFKYNLATKSKELVKEQEIPSGHNKDDYIVERVEFKSHDGRMVPLTITRHKKQKLMGLQMFYCMDMGLMEILCPQVFLPQD